MIQIAGHSYAFDDPVVLAALGGAAAVLLLFVLLILAVTRAGRTRPRARAAGLRSSASLATGCSTCRTASSSSPAG